MRWTQLTLCALLLSINCVAGAQQFNADNQWVAPYGVGTVAATTGEEYSTLVLVAALVPEWKFNLGETHYDSSSEGLTESHHTGTLYVKHRFYENEQASGGLAIMAGTGIDPGHLEAGEVTDTFESWWANLVYTIPFNDGQVT